MKKFLDSYGKWIFKGLITITILVALFLLFRGCGRRNTTGTVLDDTSGLARGVGELEKREASLYEKIFGTKSSN